MRGFVFFRGGCFRCAEITAVVYRSSWQRFRRGDLKKAPSKLGTLLRMRPLLNILFEYINLVVTTPLLIPHVLHIRSKYEVPLRYRISISGVVLKLV